MTTKNAKDLGMPVIPPGSPGADGFIANAGEASGADIDWSNDIFNQLADKE